MRTIAGFMASLWLSACAMTNYYQQTVESWQGGDAKLLVARWGMPNQMLTTESGITYYIYTTASYHRFPYPVTPDFVIVTNRSGQTIGAAIPSNSPEEYIVHCTTSFAVNKQNKIIAATYSGGDCRANEKTRQMKSNSS